MKTRIPRFLRTLLATVLCFLPTSAVFAEDILYFTDFESVRKPSYALGTIDLDGLNWELNNVLINPLPADRAIGAASARFRHQADNPPTMTLVVDFAQGIGEVLFLFARYGTDAGATFVLEYSTNAGSSWTQAGEEFNTANLDELTEGAVEIGVAGPVRVRFRGTGGGANARYNIDNVAFTNPAPPEPVGPPSAYPADFAAVVAGASAVRLTWTDVALDPEPRGYWILADSADIPAAPIDGTPPTADADFSDGAGAVLVNQATEFVVLRGFPLESTVNFSIHPFTNTGAAILFPSSGIAPVLTVNLPIILQTQPFNEFGDWTVQTLGANPEWEIVDGQAEANAFGSSGPADDWLISPPIEVFEGIATFLEFSSNRQFADAGLEGALNVLVSFDYTGEGDPSAATWQNLNPTLATSLTPVVTPPVELNPFGIGTAFIAFRYRSSGTAGASSERWRIDDVFIFSTEPPPPERRLELSLLPAEVLETDGANASTLTITLTDDPDSYPLTITLESSDSAAVTLPATVSLTSGRTVQVPVGVVADGVFTGDRTVVIAAEAEGFPGLPASLLIRETDPRPEITLSLSTPLVFDDAGANAATGTVSLSAAPASGFPFTVALSADVSGVVDFPSSVAFTSGLTAEFPIGVIAGSAAEGSQTVNLTAAADPYVSGSASLEVRPATTAGVPALGLVLPPRLREGTSGEGFIFLSTPAATAVVVQLTGSDATELAVPASVTVPAGAAVASFAIEALLDGIIDGDQTVSIIASAEGYATATATLVVEDADRPRFLELIPSTVALDEGAQMTVRARLSEPPGVSRTLLLTSSDARLLVPESVAVEPNDSEVTFFITAMDDGVFGPDRTVLLTARIEGYVPAEATATIRNIQPAPALQLGVTPTVVFDNAGADLPRARLSLSSPPAGGFPVVVSLSAEPAGILNLPLDVELGSLAERLVSIGVLPGAAGEGPVEVTVTASAPGVASSSAAVTVRPAITPPDVALELTAPARLREGESATVTVRLPDAPGTPISVALSSSDTSELIVPAGVTIPADAPSATFTITAVADGLVDGDQTVTLLATAPGFSAATATIVVEDADRAPEMMLSAGASSVDAGRVLFVTASLNMAPGEARTLRLRTNDTRLTVPAEVPVGAAAVDVVFIAEAPQQLTFQPNTTVRIVAELDGYPAAFLDLEVINTVPRAVFLRPFDGQRFAIGQNVTLELDVAGPLDGLQEVVFLIDGAPVASFERPPFRSELSFSELGPRSLRAIVRDGVLGDFQTALLNLEVVFNPVVNDRDFLVQTYRDLLDSDPVEPAFSIYLERLRSGQSTRAQIVELMIQGAAFRRIEEGISLHYMLLGRPVAWDEFFRDEIFIFATSSPIFGVTRITARGWNDFAASSESLFFDPNGRQPGGLLGLAYYVLNYSVEFPIAIGGNPSDLRQAEYFRYLWHHRHGVEPTAQQEVQANFRVTTYRNNQDAPHTNMESLNYARARFAAAMARGDRIGGLDVIYNPPNQDWRDYARGAALFMSFWRGNASAGVPSYEWTYEEARAAGRRPLLEFIEELLQSPLYRDRFGHNFLGASRLAGTTWHRSSWMGWFHYETQTFPWIYHDSGTWLYVITEDEGSSGIWVWHPQDGWLWTTDRAYPFAYRPHTGGWIEASF